MKNIELYNKSVNTLLDAYNSGTLSHGNCHACAVGNIIAASRGITITDYTWDVPKSKEPKWTKVFSTVDKKYRDLYEIRTEKHHTQRLDMSKYENKAKEQIDSTGYTVKELADIEFAFESSIGADNTLKFSKKGQFIGLCAVLNVLKEIHETKEDIHSENTDRLKTIYDKCKTEVV